MGYSDEAGHQYGWMSDEYMEAIHNSWDNIERVISVLPEDYTVFITADHGGHDRMHGTDLKGRYDHSVHSYGERIFEANSRLENISIKDIAPTVANLLCVTPDDEWEGNSII